MFDISASDSVTSKRKQQEATTTYPAKDKRGYRQKEPPVIMDKFIDILHHYSPLISLITFFIGLYAGNRQALWVDKRREFNALAEPLLAYYEQVAHEAGNRNSFSSASLSFENVNKVRRRLPARKQAEFVALFERIAEIKPRWTPDVLDEIHLKAKRMCRLLRMR